MINKFLILITILTFTSLLCEQEKYAAYKAGLITGNIIGILLMLLIPILRIILIIRMGKKMNNFKGEML